RVVAAVGRAPGERSGPGRDLPVAGWVAQDAGRDPDDDAAEPGVREATIGEPLVEVRELPGDEVLDVAEEDLDLLVVDRERPGEPAGPDVGGGGPARRGVTHRRPPARRRRPPGRSRRRGRGGGGGLRRRG